MTHRDLEAFTSNLREQHDGHAPGRADYPSAASQPGDPGSSPGSRSEPTAAQVVAFYAAVLAVVLLCLGTWFGFYLVIT